MRGRLPGILMAGFLSVSTSPLIHASPPDEELEAIRGRLRAQPRLASASTIPGDFDGDGSVDSFDYKVMQICMSLAGGPGHALAPACLIFDFDVDYDVDLKDVATFMRLFGTADADGDGVIDLFDNCPFAFNPDQVDSNSNGIGDACESSCGNGTVEYGEQCDDGNTTSGDGCSATCQTEAAGPRCGDGHVDSGEGCDDGNTVPGDGCNTFCQREPVCGNGQVELGETCDDGNTTAGDGCSATCQLEGNVVPNDACENAKQISDGAQNFNTILATTDGSADPACNFFSNNQVNNDIWYCYTATCTGSAVISLCGSSYDTKLAVYNGCGCPAAGPLACNDDGCGSGVERVESRVTARVTSGQKYMVRVGGYIGARGDGKLTIRCGVDTCANATNDCFAANATNNPGCSDATCCQKTCALDTFCCDVAWDSFCAGEASGVCTGNFPACAAGSGSCGSAHTPVPGCDNTTCCNTVCGTDPYCCLTEWDQNCVDEAQSACFLSCNSRAGDCLTAHATPGCNLLSCCEKICPTDPFCCDTEWDADCATKANAQCP